MNHAQHGRPDRRSILGLGLGAAATAATLPILTAGPAAAVSAADAVNDYPYKTDPWTQVDPWNFFKRECTSFVAWRLNRRNGFAFHNYWRNVHWGDASNWITAAGRAELTVNRTARVGAVAVPDGYGHVAWVNRIKSDGTISYEEYNWNPSHEYNHRVLAPGGFRYIHFPT